MSEFPPPNTGSHRLPARGALGQSSGADIVGDLRLRLMRIAVLPAVALAVLGVAAGYLLAADPPRGVVITTLAGGVAGCALVVIAAVNSANSVALVVHGQFHGVEQELGVLRSWTAYFREDITQYLTKIRNGERPVPHDPPAEPTEYGDPMAALVGDLRQALYTAEVSVAQAADMTLGGDPVQQLQVFANLGRRQQSLIHRALRMLDNLERLVEDPDLLEGIFGVDHLVTGMRRQAENLVILGGAKAPRQWSTPSGMVAVLRSATAEVEQYNRVKILLPVEGTLRGHAVTEVIHLLAELIENATVFSDPDTQVMLRARSVRAGLAIEVEDRGLGMQPEDLDRINDLLSTPDSVDIRELLNDGLIGLWVVAQLARRNDVHVRLQTNIFGGITADVVLPRTLLGDDSNNTPSQPRRRELTSAGVPAALGRAIAQRLEPGSTRSQDEGPLSVGRHHEVRGRITTSSEPNDVPQRSAEPPPPPPPAREQAKAPYEYRWPASLEELDVTAHGSVSSHPTDEQDRPSLPKRPPGTTNLAPQLLNPPMAIEPATEPGVGHSPTLVARFQRGIRAGIGEEHSDSVDSTDRTI